MKNRFIAFFMVNAFLSILLSATGVEAHKLAPSLLEIKEKENGIVEVFWKESIFQQKGKRVEPVLPQFCAPIGKTVTEVTGTGMGIRWRADCNGNTIKGSFIKINSNGKTSVCVVLRIMFLDGQRIQTILTQQKPVFQVPSTQRTSQVMKNYMVLGLKHLFSGFDHMLFITGLLFLIRKKRVLLWTITAFTVGHSVTLSLAALGLIRFPSSWIEFGIACSIFILAVEVASRKESTSKGSWLYRRPWAMAAAFGLLHGLGFASALGEIGLPRSDIPVALFSFNVGIELGQCAWVFFIWGVTSLYKGLSLPVFYLARQAAVYTMGTCASYWCIARFFEAFL